jgi:phage terminase large subunit-like protein
MDVERCQALISRIGISAFLDECQHEVQGPAGGMFDHLVYAHCKLEDLPALVRTVVWVDPAVTDTDSSDAHAIQVDSIGVDDKIYRRWSWEQRATPLDSSRLAVRKAVEFGADHVGIETDQRGDTWQSVYREACRSLVHGETLTKETRFPPFTWKKAGDSKMTKTERAGRMLAKGYELGRIVHVLGTHAALERGLRRFPLKKPFDLVEANYWAWDDQVRRAISSPSRRST